MPFTTHFDFRLLCVFFWESKALTDDIVVKCTEDEDDRAFVLTRKNVNHDVAFIPLDGYEIQLHVGVAFLVSEKQAARRYTHIKLETP